MNPLLLLKFISPTGWMAIIGGLVIAFAGVQTLRIHHAKADLAAARAALIDPATHKTWQAEAEQRQRDLTQCQTNRQALQTSIDAQNADIDRWKLAATQAQDDSAKALSIAQTATAAASKQVAGILAAKPGTDACASADALILGSLK